MAEEEQVSRLKIEISSDTAPVKDIAGAIRDLMRDIRSMTDEVEANKKATAEFVMTARQIAAALNVQAAEHRTTAAAMREHEAASKASKAAIDAQTASTKQSLTVLQLESAELRNAYAPALKEIELRTKTYNEARVRATASVAEATREDKIYLSQLRVEGAEIDLTTKAIRGRTAAINEEIAQMNLRDRQAKSGSAWRSVPGVVQAAALISSVSVIARALDDVGKATLGFNSLIETSSMQLKVLTGSADVASKHLQDLQAFAVKTPFELPGLIEQSKMLQEIGRAHV